MDAWEISTFSQMMEIENFEISKFEISAREQCELRLFAAVTIQQWWRACMKRDRYLRLQEFITSLQAVARRYLAKQKLAQVILMAIQKFPKSQNLIFFYQILD